MSKGVSNVSMSNSSKKRAEEIRLTGECGTACLELDAARPALKPGLKLGFGASTGRASRLA
jgi:hypothetical protein